MGLLAQAASDVQKNLERDGEPVTFLDPDDVEYPVVGAQVLSVTAHLDPETNIQVPMRRTAITAALAALVDGDGVAFDPEPAVSGSSAGWRIRYVLAGVTFTRMITAKRPDHTIGYVNFILEEYDEEA
jgi:hypothetical protein